MYEKLLRVLGDPKFKFTEAQRQRLQIIGADVKALYAFDAVASIDPYDYFYFHRYNTKQRITSWSSYINDYGDDDFGDSRTQTLMDGRARFTFEQADQFYLDATLCQGQTNDSFRLKYLVAKTLVDAEAGNLQLGMARERTRHSFLTYQQIKESVKKNYRVDVPPHLSPIEGLYTVDDCGRYVLCKTDKMERGIAAMLYDIHQRRNPLDDDEDSHWMPMIEDADQAQAVKYALRGGVSIIYGPPGTGKTHTIGKIIDCFEAQQMLRYTRIMAPTGKAAKNVTDRLRGRVVATTMHRALYQDLSACDVLVIDEVSLVAYNILYQILSKIEGGDVSTVVLVGDDKQLPSISQGQVMRDLLLTDLPKTELKTMYRSGGKGEATRQLILLGKEGVRPTGVDGVFDIQIVATGLQYKASALFVKTLKTIKAWWIDLKHKHGDRVSCISNIKNTCNVVGNMLQVEENRRVKAKMRVGNRVKYIETKEWKMRNGVVEAVHDAYPDEKDDFFRYTYDIRGSNNEFKGPLPRCLLRPSHFEQGDFVQLTKNTKDGRYVNGDDGVYEEEKWMETCDGCWTPLESDIDDCWCTDNEKTDIHERATHLEKCYAVKILEDDHTSRVVYALADDVDYAYVRTVHKFQGLQNKAIMFITGSTFGNRPMLYTGCSRWEEQLVLITTGPMLETMLHPSEERQTRLTEFVQELLISSS